MAMQVLSRSQIELFIGIAGMWSSLWLLSGSDDVSAAIVKADEIIAAQPANREVIYQRALLLSRLAGRQAEVCHYCHIKLRHVLLICSHSVGDRWLQIRNQG